MLLKMQAQGIPGDAAEIGQRGDRPVGLPREFGPVFDAV